MSQAPGLLATAIHSPTQRVSGLLGFLQREANEVREAPASTGHDELAPWVD
ncbi:hypothetical protein D3C71_1592140 [compost metagenome]